MSFEEQFPIFRINGITFENKYTLISMTDIEKFCLDKQKVKETIISIRDYCQSEYDKLSKNDYEENIERVGQIRILNKLLEELKL